MIDPATPVRLSPIAVLDVETTGLAAERGDRVCEIAIVRADPGSEPLAFSMLVDPERPISRGAMAVNGIRDCDVTGAPRFAEIVDEIDLRLSGAVLVAHNAPFDLGFLAAEYARARRTAPVNPVIDTLALARSCFAIGRTTGGNGLGSIARRLGIEPRVAHRAEGDAWTTLEVFRRMSTLLAARGRTTVGELMLAQGGARGGARSPQADAGSVPEPLGTAIAQRRLIVIRYRDGARRTTQRTIEPVLASREHLVAFCHLRGEERTFRLDRILAAWWPE